jgi:hypothetical protein
MMNQLPIVLAVFTTGCQPTRRPITADADVVAGDGATSCKSVDILTYTSAGPDGSWGTPDDLVGGREVLELDGTAHWGLDLRYSGAGPDRAWDDSDDVVGMVFKSTYTNDRVATIAQYNDPGPDGMWGTSDDAPVALSSYAYDGSGRMTRLISANSAGPDGVWGTADDPIAAWWVFRYPGPAALPSWLIMYNDPGPDRTWGDADDIGSQSIFSQSGTTGSTRLVIHGSPGADHVWGNDDDIVQSILDVACDASGRSITTYVDPGADHVWGTADDTIGSRQRVSVHGDSCGFDLCQTQIF